MLCSNCVLVMATKVVLILFFILFENCASSNQVENQRNNIATINVRLIEYTLQLHTKYTNDDN